MKKTIRKNKTMDASSDRSSTSSTTPPKTVLVRIEFEHPTAQAVCIAGSFNDWRPRATEMISLGEGRWAKEPTLPPGEYEYLLVVDGRWVPDPNARSIGPNPFGGCNCLLAVAQPSQACRMRHRCAEKTVTERRS